MQRAYKEDKKVCKLYAAFIIRPISIKVRPIIQISLFIYVNLVQVIEKMTLHHLTKHMKS